MNGIRLSILAAGSLAVAACGNSPAPVDGASGVPVSPACAMDHLAEAAILDITREPPDAPLADLSHYAPRRAARAPGFEHNSGACAGNTRFRYAAGRGDITGAASGSSMSGYVDPEQISVGPLDRQWARAFIIASDCDGRSGHAVLVQMDIGLVFHAIRQGVIDAIQADPELSQRYGDHNVLLNASHSHNSAAGQSHFDAYHVLTGGHDAQNYAAAVDGVLAAIRRADAALADATPGPISYAQGELLNGTVQRSLPAFLQNPEAERGRFVDTRGDEVRTNRMMSLLRLQRDDGTPVGMVNWYAIHGTSIYQHNELLSGDNKGYAAYRFERDFRERYPEFLAGFMQADEGDASPNIFITELSQAEQRDLESEGFRARGGGRTEAEHALISGHKQYRKARDLWDAAGEPLTGEVRAAALFVDFSRVVVDAPRDYPAALQPEDGLDFATCGQALGVSFGGGAEDGRGPTAEGQTCANTSEADLQQAADFLGSNAEAAMGGALPPGLIVPAGCDNPIYDAQGYDCHAEKPLLFALNQRSPFVSPPSTQTLEPTTQKLQVILIGNLAVVALPWEVTTTSGRRLREAVLDAIQGAGIDYAVISGLSNGFVHYLTTREEYSVQHYEGASTIFGPWTQEAAEQELVRLAGQLARGEPASSPFENPGFRSHVSNYTNAMSRDDGNPPVDYGTVVQPPDPSYRIGPERVTVQARFVAGHPRNDLFSDDSFLFVEREDGGGNWTAVQTDDDHFTRFSFAPEQDDGSHHAVIDWIVPAGTPPGRYRIRHQGATADGRYQGVTEPFELEDCR